MSYSTDHPGGPVPGDPFEVSVRGYSRQQVDEYTARVQRRVRDLEDRLARALQEAERLRAELAAARQEAASPPPREQPSERIAQLLKLAGDEARAQQARVDEEVSRLRAQAQQEAEAIRAEAAAQAEQIVKSAREISARTMASAQADADAATGTARTEAEQARAQARQQAEAVLAQATAQAQQEVDEAAARAEGILDRAQHRLAQLVSGHTEAMRRLSEIRDVLTGLPGRTAAEDEPDPG